MRMLRLLPILAALAVAARAAGIESGAGFGVPVKSIADELGLSLNLEAQRQKPDAPKTP